LFWKSDCAYVLAVGIPQPYTFRASDVEVAIHLDLHTVGDTLVMFSWFCVKNPTTRKHAIEYERRKAVSTNGVCPPL